MNRSMNRSQQQRMFEVLDVSYIVWINRSLCFDPSLQQPAEFSIVNIIVDALRPALLSHMSDVVTSCWNLFHAKI